jgi:hypothetical protein
MACLYEILKPIFYTSRTVVLLDGLVQTAYLASLGFALHDGQLCS